MGELMVTEADLEYMRGVQDDFRPTPAQVIDRQETPDGMGGQTTSAGDPTDVTIRVGQKGLGNDRMEALVSEYGTAVLVVTLDLVPIRSGDQIKVSETEVYECVTDGDPNQWATGQRVGAVRRVWP
jgi:hypothetical protein